MTSPLSCSDDGDSSSESEGQPDAATDRRLEGGGDRGTDGQSADEDGGSAAHEAGVESGDSALGTDCQQAITLAVNKVARGIIDVPGKAVFYRLRVKEQGLQTRTDAYLRIHTHANPSDDPNKLDTVLTIYDQSGKKVAAADDSFPRENTDSELYFHSPVGAEYCIKVEDYSAWVGETPRGEDTYSYELYAETLSDAEVGDNRDREPNDDPKAARSVSYDMNSGENPLALVYGMFDTPTDVDVYKIQMPPGTASAEVYFTPTGPDGYGATIQPGAVRITDLDGGTLAELDARKGALGISLPVMLPFTGLLWVNRPLGVPPGTNDFYFIKHYAYATDLRPEMEGKSGKNDILANAEPLRLETYEWDASLKEGSVLGVLRPASDIDYFLFYVNPNALFELFCGAQRQGSGLIGATFSLEDSMGATIQSETEVDTADVSWSDTDYELPSKPGVHLEGGGRYYLRVSAGGQSDTVSGDYYRCKAYVSYPQQ